MRLDVRCPSAPWENTTREEDVAYDIAYNLAEEYQQPVDLYYNHTGTLCTTVYPQFMRIILLTVTIFTGIQFGFAALATVNQQQEKRAEQICQITPEMCNK